MKIKDVNNTVNKICANCGRLNGNHSSDQAKNCLMALTWKA